MESTNHEINITIIGPASAGKSSLWEAFSRHREIKNYRDGYKDARPNNKGVSPEEEVVTFSIEGISYSICTIPGQKIQQKGGANSSQIIQVVKKKSSSIIILTLNVFLLDPELCKHALLQVAARVSGQLGLADLKLVWKFAVATVLGCYGNELEKKIAGFGISSYGLPEGNETKDNLLLIAENHLLSKSDPYKVIDRETQKEIEPETQRVMRVFTKTADNIVSKSNESDLYLTALRKLSAQDFDTIIAFPRRDIIYLFPAIFDRFKNIISKRCRQEKRGTKFHYFYAKCINWMLQNEMGGRISNIDVFIDNNDLTCDLDEVDGNIDELIEHIISASKSQIKKNELKNHRTKKQSLKLFICVSFLCAILLFYVSHIATQFAIQGIQSSVNDTNNEISKNDTNLKNLQQQLIATNIAIQKLHEDVNETQLGIMENENKLDSVQQQLLAFQFESKSMELERGDDWLALSELKDQEVRHVVHFKQSFRQIPIVEFEQSQPLGIRDHSALSVHIENISREKFEIVYKPDKDNQIEKSRLYWFAYEPVHKYRLLAMASINKDGQVAASVGEEFSVKLLPDSGGIRYEISLKQPAKFQPLIVATCDGGDTGCHAVVTQVKKQSFVVEGRNFFNNGLGRIGFDFMVFDVPPK